MMCHSDHHAFETRQGTIESDGNCVIGIRKVKRNQGAAAKMIFGLLKCKTHSFYGQRLAQLSTEWTEIESQLFQIFI